MSEQLVSIVLIVLSLLVALNIKLTLSLIFRVNNPESFASGLRGAQVGDKVSKVFGKLNSSVKVAIADQGIPSVLLFLSPRCPSCREHLPVVGSILSKSQEAGFDLWIITPESRKRMKHFLKSSRLIESVLFIKKKDFKTLNPTSTYPFYMFLDEKCKLQASGIVGDDDWQSFTEQVSNLNHRDIDI